MSAKAEFMPYVLIGLVFLATGCHRPPAATPVARPVCPSPSVVEAVHAVAFYLEHGDAAVAGAEADALLSTHSLNDEELRGRVTQLRDAARLTAADPNAAKLLTEQTRAWMSDWECLSESLHEAAHRRLPPIHP